MTPRRLDAAVVQRKLGLLAELLDDLDTVGEIDGQRLHDERLTRHAIERLLTQVVQLAVDVNAHLAAALAQQTAGDYRSSFLAAARLGAISDEMAEALLPSVGLRNLLVHEYATIDLDLVAAAALRAREQYRDYVRAIAAFLSRQPNG